MSTTDRRIRAGFLSSIAVLIAIGCGPAAERETYPLSGRVVSVDLDKRRVTIDHAEIPGYMPAMTMPFRVKDDWVFQAISPGSGISANLVVEGKGSWLENVVVTSAPGAVGSPSTVDGATEPIIGERAPAFSLTTHRDRPVSLESLKGSVVVLTFIFSRCPLPDYCPLMTDNFVTIDRSVLADPALAGRVRLLSISIDPEFDTPAILRVHAGEVARVDGRVPDNWDFATADPATIRKVAESYGLVYGKEDGQIVHSLRTAVIGRDGRLLKVYRGNEWKPEEILADVRAAVN